MKPLSSVKVQIVSRVRKDTVVPLQNLARSQGLKVGPFLAHISESLALCPPEKFHAAMAEFVREAGRR